MKCLATKNCEIIHRRVLRIQDTRYKVFIVNQDAPKDSELQYIYNDLLKVTIKKGRNV